MTIRRLLTIRNFCWVVLLVSTACSSCKLLNKKDTKKGDGQAETVSLFVDGKLYLERTSNLTEAIIRFETTVEVSCEIQYWLQSKGKELEAKDRESIGCSGSGEKTSFSEVVSSLKASELYFFEVIAWSLDDPDRKNESRIILAETELKSDSIAYIARVNLPLRSLEVHQIDLPEGKTAEKMLEENRSKLGCVASDSIAPKPWSVRSKQSSFNAMSTRGYITGTAERMKNSNNIFRLYYNSVQSGDSWEWSVKTNLGNGQFLAKKAPIIQRATITGVNKIDMGTPQLSVAEKSVAQYDGQSDLRVTVAVDTANNSNSLVNIQLGFPGSVGSKTCFFNASESPFLIAKDVFSGFEKGKLDVLVTIYGEQIQQDIEKKLPPWIIETYDWRVARIEVL